MSDTQKTIKILEEIPSEISSKLSMREIFEVLSIMLGKNDSDIFEPSAEDFIEALSIRLQINNGLENIKNDELYTTNELLEEMKKW